MNLRLKELRKQSGMTQQELANKLGVTQATLSGWENGKYEIDNESLRRCSKIFMVSMDYLFNASMDSEEIAYARKKTKALYEQQSPDIKLVEGFLGVNFATFRSWYQGLGDYFSNVSNLIKLADLFKVSLYVLLGKTDFSTEENYIICENISVLIENKKIPSNTNNVMGIDLTFGAIQKFEYQFTRESLAQFASYFGVSVDYLLRRTETTPTPSLSVYEQQLINNFRLLNEEGQEKLLDHSIDLVSSGRYIKSSEHKMVSKNA